VIGEPPKTPEHDIFIGRKSMIELERGMPFPPQYVHVVEHIGADFPAKRLRACNHRTHVWSLPLHAPG
jgi:hypothetical protein